VKSLHEYYQHCLKFDLDLKKKLEKSFSAFSSHSDFLESLFLFYSKENVCISPESLNIKDEIIHIGQKYFLKDSETLNFFIKKLIPWKKGPYSLFGNLIDSEWKCDIKWNRLSKYLPLLSEKIILDIGCNSGYFLFRFLEYQPKLIVGLEPYYLFFFQYLLLFWPFIKNYPIFYLPLRSNDFASSYQFDLILDMGILYHQKDPLTHLKFLKQHSHKKTIIVLETLIYDNSESISLCPYPRYASMRNVYFIPSLSCLKNWCHQVGFIEFQVIDISYTSTLEQRSTPFSSAVSLIDFLDTKNHMKTKEGYQAPCRAMILLQS